MKKKVFIGIDFSKLTIDVTFFNAETPDLVYYQVFANTEEGCIKMIKWIKKTYPNTLEWLVCGEYTGIYTMTLALALNEQNIDLWLENPMQIKLSSGISREKSDRVDSRQIALYAARFKDRVKLYKPQGEVLLKVRELVRHKDRLTKVKTQLKVPAKELKRVRKSCEVAASIDSSSQKVIDVINQEMKDVEHKMMFLLKSDPELKRLYKLVTSVVGVGMQTAIYLLIHTSGLTSFATPRQLACYCGVAPFAKRSGTSIKGKTQVSHIANKKLKTLLHMCALNAVRYDPIIKQYYERKLEEGKHKMNILNNVRNKLIHRIWAVVQSGEEYDKNYHPVGIDRIEDKKVA